jgi:hypothetical protein
MGKQLADKANRDGGAERFPAPAVPQSLAVARALLGDYEPLRRALALPSGKAAKPPAPHTLYLLQTVPGIGKILCLVLRYARHESQRVPRGQACVSYCCRVTGAKASAGTRDGTAGATIGQA